MVPCGELRGKGGAGLACQGRRELLTLVRAAGSQTLLDADFLCLPFTIMVIATSGCYLHSRFLNPCLCVDSRLKVDYPALPTPHIREITAVIYLSFFKKIHRKINTHL